ncbi:MAG TPA: molybdenum cofactor biosynthesis protein MoaE [Acidimicrobiales bacterium]|nr:molybdenum cofactor biosynthesis protein MoaE [Acidimicrobiales bacterium]
MSIDLEVPESGDDWIGLTDQPLPATAALEWSVLGGCGAEVLFSGTVRDNAEGRPGVIELEYEVYEQAGLARLAAIAAEARKRWSDLGRVVLLHRTGRLQIGECSVIVVVSAPHRGVAFDAAEWCIDTLKATVPIWKRETWEGGVGWGTDATDIATISEEGRVPS